MKIFNREVREGNAKNAKEDYIDMGENHLMRISELKQLVDTTVTLRMKDGEIAKVKVNFVDEESENIIAVVEETSCPEHRRAPCAVCTFAAEDIVSAESQ